MENEKSVLITGASGGGIGLAIAEAVAKEGYTVVAHYNRNSGLNSSMSIRILATFTR